MPPELFNHLADQSGTLLLSVLIVWRLDRQLSRLCDKIDALVEAVLTAPTTVR